MATLLQRPEQRVQNRRKKGEDQREAVPVRRSLQ
jgi:hypothetical protein